ncbi:MAG TPA: hypothetical protein VND64_33070 [Pirellulales bacterium]|nr:hypothetical protein [Pirellulales bacterium]
MKDSTEQDADRPFPWRCPHCRENEVYPAIVAHTAEVLFDGRRCELTVPDLAALRCRSCAELVFDARVDEQLNDVLRRQFRLLTPSQIRDAFAALDMPAGEIAADLGVAEAVLSKWAAGTLIQSRANDQLLRGYFASPAVRSALKTAVRDASFGTIAVLAAPATRG